MKVLHDRVFKQTICQSFKRLILQLKDQSVELDQNIACLLRLRVVTLNPVTIKGDTGGVATR